MKANPVWVFAILALMAVSWPQSLFAANDATPKDPCSKALVVVKKSPIKRYKSLLFDRAVTSFELTTPSENASERVADKLVTFDLTRMDADGRRAILNTVSHFTAETLSGNKLNIFRAAGSKDFYLRATRDAEENFIRSSEPQSRRKKIAGAIRRVGHWLTKRKGEAAFYDFKIELNSDEVAKIHFYKNNFIEIYSVADLNHIRSLLQDAMGLADTPFRNAASNSQGIKPGTYSPGDLVTLDLELPENTHTLVTGFFVNEARLLVVQDNQLGTLEPVDLHLKPEWIVAHSLGLHLHRNTFGIVSGDEVMIRRPNKAPTRGYFFGTQSRGSPGVWISRRPYERDGDAFELYSVEAEYIFPVTDVN